MRSYTDLHLSDNVMALQRANGTRVSPSRFEAEFMTDSWDGYKLIWRQKFLPYYHNRQA